MAHWIYIALGGATGAMLRNLILLLLGQSAQGFPLGTFAANSLGCFIAGLLIPFWNLWPPGVKAFIMAGFLGALTTYSSFAVDIVTLITNQKAITAFFYLSLTLIICLSFCFFGYYLGQKLAA
ncbi:MAG: CrcB family protein [Oligoflexales bacterium]|nr:CrcB family protein [Oligoflexales bacterium]